MTVLCRAVNIVAELSQLNCLPGEMHERRQVCPEAGLPSPGVNNSHFLLYLSQRSASIISSILSLAHGTSLSILNFPLGWWMNRVASGESLGLGQSSH